MQVHQTNVYIQAMIKLIGIQLLPIMIYQLRWWLNMNKDINIVIEKIEEIFIDSDLSLYEAIGVLETVKQLLFKALELQEQEVEETEEIY